MDKNDVKKLFTLLEQFYPNSRKDDTFRAAWELALKPYRYEEVKAAAVKYARTGKYFPDVADITAGLVPVNDAEPQRVSEDLGWMRKYITHREPSPVTRYAGERGITWGAAKEAMANGD